MAGTHSLKDLLNTITTKLQESMLPGVELYGKKENCVYSCKLLKVLDVDVDKIHYEVGWLGKDKKVISSSVINADDIIRKKLPFSREVLKSFIRESTCQSAPWVVHENLARMHEISTEPPKELQDKFSMQDGCLGSSKKRRKAKDVGENSLDAKKGEIGKVKRKELETENSEGLPMIKKAKKDETPKEEAIKYPIDDLLVQPGADDQVFTELPSPSRDFGIPMDCVGDLLMVWDFCSSFSRLLHLWPFSLEDFENAICYKDSNLTLIMESHSALLRLLIKDEGEYFMAVQKKKRKSKITLINWTEYLCDFLEMGDIPELSIHRATIKRGHYGLLDSHTKLGILRELVSQALATNVIREQLDEYIEEQQALAATKRGEALEAARKKREEKELLKEESDTKELTKGHSLENGGSNLFTYNDCNNGQNEDIPEQRVEEVVSSKRNHVPENREEKHLNTTLRKIVRKQKMDVDTTAENTNEPSSKEENRKAQNQRKDKGKEAQEKKSREHRKEQLEREMEKRLIRTNPLGKDRNYNRYWFFRRNGRIFVESFDSKLWGYFSAKEELDALMGSLNCKGERERALQKQLEKYYDRICSALQKRSKDIAHKIAIEEAVLRRSTRVRAPPRDNPAMAFLRYANKWKED